MTPPVLALEGAGHAYPGNPVLDRLDLAVRAGTALAVLGRNGSGKTTLLRLLTGALRPRPGRLLLDGEPVRYDRRGLLRLRQQVQLVAQDPDDQLFSADVTQDVSFGPLNLGLPADRVRARVAEALAALDVAHLADRPTHQLSFGQKKRVAIAGALAMRPRVLVLDEPTAGLDPAGVGSTLAVLRRLRAAGTTVVMATHDLDLAFSWADEVAVLTAGRVRTGRPEELLADAALLADAGLTAPWALALGTRLRALGLLPAGPLPRTRGELLAALPLPADHQTGDDAMPERTRPQRPVGGGACPA